MLIYKFNVVPIRTPTEFLLELARMIMEKNNNEQLKQYKNVIKQSVYVGGLSEITVLL